MGDADDDLVLRPIGRVVSPLDEPGAAPRQPDEGAPAACIEVDDHLRDAIADLVPGHEVLVLTWLDRADRTVLAVHPRDDPARPVQSVFLTRSADRPNPIGLHQVQIVAVEGTRIRVAALEAVDGTPVLDIKPPLGPPPQR